MNTGYGEGYPPEEGSNIAPAGLYTFDVEVMGPAYYYDADWLRSRALTVDRLNTRIISKKEFWDFWYNLRSNRNASSGVGLLYDPDLQHIAIYNVSSLQCLAHGSEDGLIAHPQGLQHGLYVHIPWSWLGKLGIYRWVMRLWDNHADFYKNHLNKPSLQIAFEVCVPRAHNYDGNDSLGAAAAAEYYQKELPDGSAYWAEKWTNGNRFEAMEHARWATIVYIANHGSPGYIQLEAQGGWIAKHHPQYTNHAAIDRNDFSAVKFIGFVGCETALTETNIGLGNLLDEAVARGATTVLGFTETIYGGEGLGSPIQTWTSEFWAAALGWLDLNPPDGQWDAPMNVSSAARHATWVIELRWGSDLGYNSYAFRGNAYLVLSPARCK